MLISTADERDTARPATIEEQVAEFTRVYEARAYLIYNLALRTTCEAKSAIAAAETAFVGLAADGMGEEALLPAAVVASLGQAKRKPKPGASADGEMDLLDASASLAPPERAALALAVLAEADSAQVGSLLLVGVAAGADLLERAVAGFAAASGVDTDAVYEIYGDWTWADPPAELWERVYPTFRKALERPLTSTATQATKVLTPVKEPRTRRRKRRLTAIATVISAGLLTAGALAYIQRNSNSTAPTAPPPPAYQSSVTPQVDPVPASPTAETDQPTDPVAAMQAKAHKPLTPQELDQLRLKELAALRNYQKRETDKRLTKAQRDYAASKVSEFKDLARQRAAVTRQEKSLRKRERELAKAQEKAAADRRKQDQGPTDKQQQSDQQSPTTSQSNQSQQPSTSSGGQSSSGNSSSGPPTSDQAEQTCVQDADTGAYICPN